MDIFVHVLSSRNKIYRGVWFMKKRKIGFVQNEKEEIIEEKQTDKLGKKSDIVVKWIHEEKVTKEENKNTIETKEEIETEVEEEMIETEKEELNNYLNLSILFQLINHHDVTMANAMRFAVDKEFCDRFLANKTKANNAGVYNELKNNRLNQLENTFTKTRNRLAQRVKKIRANNNNNGIATIDLILSGEKIDIVYANETDIKYIKKGIKLLKDTLKEIKEIGEFINYNERGMVIIIRQFEDILKRL